MNKVMRRSARVAGKRAAPPPGVQDLHEALDPVFPIIGVGASAGGLEAFSALLRHIEPRDDLALVLIQHLDPTHSSLLREALIKTTTMIVEVAVAGTTVRANHVYVIPPNTCLGIVQGKLTLVVRPEDPKVQHLPVDFFFRALAQDRGSRAIGVILSGNASDGTEGLRAIKEAGGITFAQAPLTAKFDGMPRSAIDAGVVDFCISIPEIGRELGRLSHHPYVRSTTPGILPAQSGDALAQLFELVRAATRVDFSEYRTATLERRIARRMALCRAETLEDYLGMVRDEPEEVKSLYEDVLIHVTGFFRDPDVFGYLRTEVFPAITKDKPEGSPLRVWVAGCSTGEEVYSLAIELIEYLGERAFALQIFGSDLSSKVIEVARAAVYSEHALRAVPEARRMKYFTKVDRGYRIVKSIRERCVFVQHDLARDPPFAKLDLASCRNVLIYFAPPLQKRVVSTFHYALNQPGFLLLGRTESISGYKQLFQVVDKPNKVFTRTALASTLRFARGPALRTESRPDAQAHAGGEGAPREDLSSRLDRLLATRYAPPGIAVNGKLEVVQFRGRTGAYLEAAPGSPQNNVMQMARDGLPMTLRTLVAKVKKGGLPVRSAGVELSDDAGKRTCDVVVLPVKHVSDAEGDLYLILFEEQPVLSAQPGAELTTPKRGHRSTDTAQDLRRMPKLREELAALKDYLQTAISEHGRVTEELGGANEDLVSGNEELQSMNEELETAKEELQSINEELTTVNDELHSRNQEVTQVNSDLVNLLTTVDIPLLILDRERRIRRFTPKARSILNVLAGDIGRPFADIRTNIRVLDLDRKIAEVIDTMSVCEEEVQDQNGRWYRLQIRPYQTGDNRIDGAILSLVDINALKELIKEAYEANSEAERANRTKDEFLATLSHELRTPLTSMLMRAQLLRRGALDDEVKIKRAAEAIEVGVVMQVQLIDDLLDVSRITTGKLRMNLQPVELASVISLTLDTLTPSLHRKGLRLETQLERGKPPHNVYGDPTRLQQIVSNLVSNAIKFTPEHGTVYVSLEQVGDDAVLRVRDTGIGIEPDFLPNVFRRFTQANSSNTRAYGGLGLGLAIVRHLVDLHHGSVAAESPGRGLGASFSVTLPLMRTATRSGSTTSKSAAEQHVLDVAVLDGLKVLVVDDDRATREVIAEMLARTGANVRLAQDSGEAMRAVDEFRPEVLLCDIAMPDEDGYAFLRRLRARDTAHSGNVPAVALTALAHDEDREQALAAGFQLHVAKPLDIDQLTAAVIELASRARRALSV